MGERVQGVVSLGFTGVSIALAALAAFLTSWVLGLGYLAISGLALAAVLVAFCAKCPCQETCGHVLPGWLARALTHRQPGPYTQAELATTGLALVLLIGLPQIWLWRYFGLLLAFWALTLLAVIQIRGSVCNACSNVHCPARVRG